MNKMVARARAWIKERSLKFRWFFQQEKTGEWKIVENNIGWNGVDGFEWNLEGCCQFTGAFDEKNTEIYEGDILYAHLDGSLGIVVYDKSNFKFFVSDDFDDYDLSEYDSANVTVIGNIYQNPDYLDGEEYGTAESIRGLVPPESTISTGNLPLDKLMGIEK